MQTCQSCHTGQLYREYVPYIQILNGQMMIVPDIPALVCDSCQTTTHDTDFLSQIEHLLDQRLQENGKAPIDERERTTLREFLLPSQANN